METKRCSKCKQEKELCRFNKAGEKLRSECKDCQRDYAKVYIALNSTALKISARKWIETHRDHKRQYDKNYRIENRERLIEASKAYKKNNKEKVAVGARNYCEQHRELQRSIVAKYRDTHKEQAKVYRKRYRAEEAEKYKAHILLSNSLRAGKIVAAGKCSVCGSEKEIHGHHEDYSKPLDIIWLCSPCHAAVHRKYNKLNVAAVVGGTDNG